MADYLLFATYTFYWLISKDSLSWEISTCP